MSPPRPVREGDGLRRAPDDAVGDLFGARSFERLGKPQAGALPDGAPARSGFPSLECYTCLFYSLLPSIVGRWLRPRPSRFWTCASLYRLNCLAHVKRSAVRGGLLWHHA